MILFFAGASFSTSTSTFKEMYSEAVALLSKQKTNFNPIQVKNQVPFWLNDSGSLLVEFVQKYYDWLADGYGHTGINVMDLATLSDIHETPDFLIPNYLKMYAPDMLGIYNIGATYQPTSDQIRNTLNNIKTEVYQRKSNEDSFRSMMVSLFGITADTIQISYPKRKLMRLNAGRFDWMPNSDYYGSTGEYSSERYAMIGSHLNQGVLPDGKMWQDFSYVLTSDIDDSNPYYEAVVKETLHPAGLLGLYEKVERYAEGGYDPGPVEDYEIPTLAHYYPYRLDSPSTLPKCTGCTGTLAKPGWYYPTFVYPTWDVEIAKGPSTNFGSIIIADFFRLNSVPGLISPNDAIGTTCNFACEATGNILFDWFIGDVLSTGVPIEQITTTNINGNPLTRGFSDGG